MRARFVSAALLAFMAGFAQAQTPTVGPLATAERAVSREGEGSRRTSLDSKERKPFDSALWAKLSDWQNGKALTNVDTQGKVVLIATWTDYLPTGKRAVQIAKSMADKYKGDVTVVLVHADQDWANATKPKAGEGATLLVAHDATGQFRKTLDIDQDPDFYVIDRAGQLRFADITNEAVEPALAMLVAEKTEDATSLTQRLADEASGIDKNARRSAAINSQASLVNIPELPFAKPSEDDYKNAKWPKRPLDESKLDKDPNAELPTKVIPLPDKGWIPNLPPRDGRATLMYILTPHAYYSYHEMMPLMDRIQRQYGRDVVCVGVMCTFERFGSRQATDEEKDPAKLMQRFEEITKARDLEHFMVPSLDTNPYRVINETATVTPLPSYLILSSDGTCRWWVHERSQVNWEAALKQVLEVDPGIKARRAVEEEWLKKNAAK
jgi:hypothetical protein